jgi:hypothetical protein
VSVTPSDATLTLDGAQVINPLDRQITEGTHTVAASREGYEPDSQEVDLSRDRQVSIRLHAVPPPPPPPHVATAPATSSPSRSGSSHASSSSSSSSSSRTGSRLGSAPPHTSGSSTGRSGSTGARGGRGSTLVTESPY